MMIYADGRTLKRNETTGVMGGQAQSHAVATKASIKEKTTHESTSILHATAKGGKLRGEYNKHNP